MIFISVEGYHEWGCGALNGTAICSCESSEEGEPKHLTASVDKQQSVVSPKLTLKQALERLDLIAQSIKEQ